MYHFSKLIIAHLLPLMLAGGLHANYIQVTNTVMVPDRNNDGIAHVQFDVQWENSWRLSNTRDAAWLFVKYREKNTSGEWNHLNLHSRGHTTSSGIKLDLGKPDEGSGYDVTTNPYVGVFMQRDDVQVTLAFKYEEESNDMDLSKQYDFRVFAIEMVYVPEGSFKVGSGGSEIGHFYRVSQQEGHTNEPFEITGEDAITTGSSGAGNLWGTGGTSGYDAVSPADPDEIPAEFPKGYAAFYVMKHSITQQQYVDFLNTLTKAQAEARYAGDRSNRNEIVYGSSGYATSNPYVANNWMSWEDGVAYAAWSGLRPMTELEFEKAARGTIAPVPNEYAWGSTRITSATGIVNRGKINETARNTDANVVFGSHTEVQGPLRVGSFGTGVNNREQSGASYYGIMELSGNLWERVVTVANAEGRMFTGRHGDGNLSADNANASVTGWPKADASGSGFRGGNWDYLCCPLPISDRLRASHTDTDRRNVRGFRAVRTAPISIED